MEFVVESKVFELLDDACFGVVVARGMDNVTPVNRIKEMLDQNVKEIKDRLGNVKVKEHSQITPYRNAFTKLGFNPNKFAPSVEALITRIAKGGQIPSINNIVDLANAVSIKYVLPIGAHDIDLAGGDITVRFSKDGDTFIPFGAREAETVEAGELVYAAGSNIKTRRWIWRQSELGKITEKSTNIFFPIDGFAGANKDAVLEARDELARELQNLFNCEVKTGFVDKDNQSMPL